jgi:glucuronyl/N-acetylglucosaminyl transferase EXT1
MNTTFALVPRGRRLATFRLLEVLHAGAIPVILADNYVLPFSDVINWSRFAIVADEASGESLPELVAYLRRIPASRVKEMIVQGRFIYATYFSSVRKMVELALEILRRRVSSTWKESRDNDEWNEPPGVIIDGCRKLNTTFKYYSQPRGTYILIEGVVLWIEHRDRQFFFCETKGLRSAQS